MISVFQSIATGFSPSALGHLVPFHELCTPVAVLKGYMEGLLDGVFQPDPETLAAAVRAFHPVTFTVSRGGPEHGTRQACRNGLATVSQKSRKRSRNGLAKVSQTVSQNRRVRL